MTIDERIEALTESVELLSHMHQDNEKKYAELFQQIATQQGRILSVVEQIAGIVVRHDKRISDLENQA